MVITGDLGDIGRTILLDLLKEKGINISGIYTDCGMQIYESENRGQCREEAAVAVVL